MKSITLKNHTHLNPLGEYNNQGINLFEPDAKAVVVRQNDKDAPGAGDIEVRMYRSNDSIFLAPGQELIIKPENEDEDIYYRSLASGNLTVTDTPVTLTYDTNGGTAIDPETVAPGTEVTLSTETTKEGFTFDAWCSDAELTTEVTKVTVNEDTTVYAKWTENVYTITFNAGEGTVDPASATTGEGRKLAELPTPVYADHTFDGWFTEAEGGTEVTTDTVFTADTTIYAHYSTEG